MDLLPKETLVEEVLTRLELLDLPSAARVCKAWASFCALPRVLASMERNSEAAILSEGFEYRSQMTSFLSEFSFLCENSNCDRQNSLFKRLSKLNVSFSHSGLKHYSVASFKLQIWRNKLLYQAFKTSNFETLCLSKVAFTHDALTDRVLLPGGVRVSFLDVILDTKNPIMLMAIANAWSDPEASTPLAPNLPKFPRVEALEATKFFNSIMENHLSSLASLTKPSDAFEQALIQIVQRFRDAFWESLMLSDPKKAPPIIKVTKSPLNLDPKVALVSGLRPYQLCCRPEHVSDFSKLGIDVGTKDSAGKSLWDNALRMHSGDLCLAMLLDARASLPDFSTLFQDHVRVGHRVVYAIANRLLGSGRKPTGAELARARDCGLKNLCDLFALIGGYPDLERVHIINDATELIGTTFEMRTDYLLLTLCFTSQGEYSAEALVSYPSHRGQYGHDWPDEINWKSSWKLLETESQLIPRLIACSIPSTAKSHAKLAEKLPSHDLYLIGYRPADAAPHTLVLAECRPSRPQKVSGEDARASILRCNHLFLEKVSK